MTIYAGLSELKITPSSSVYLAGYAARKNPSEGIHDELYAKCIYLEKNYEKVALVAMDLVGLPRKVVYKIRTQVKDSLGFDNIIIACTHTHSGPNTISFLNTFIDNKWIESIINKVVKLIIDAVNKKNLAKIGTIKSNVYGIGKNRRGNKSSIDPELGVIKVVNMREKVIGIIINFTCHPTVLDANNMLISADFPAYLYKHLSKYYPETVIIFTNGAAGDINIGYSADDSALGKEMKIRTYKKANKIGLKITRQVIKVIDNVIFNNGCFNYKRVNVFIPIKEDLPDLNGLKIRLNNTQKRISQAVNYDERNKLEMRKIYDEILLSKIEALHGNNVIQTELNFLLLNKTVLVTIPGELFCKLGLKIKSLCKRKNIFIVGYANDYISYIPTSEAFAQKGYEIETSIFTENVGQILIKKIKNNLYRL